MSDQPKRGSVAIQSWYGRIEYPVVILGETPKRYRVRFLCAARMPKWTAAAGDVRLVPKTAVKMN